MLFPPLCWVEAEAACYSILTSSHFEFHNPISFDTQYLILCVLATVQVFGGLLFLLPSELAKFRRVLSLVHLENSNITYQTIFP